MIKANTAIKMLLAIIGAVLIFHLLIILRVIPYEQIWGGRLKNERDMLVFESFSFLINILLSITLMIKGGLLSLKIPQIVISKVLWFFFVLFVLNTVANLFAKTILEKSFSILTLLFVVLIGIVLRESKSAERLKG
jgi:hypothetical protein